MYQVLLLIMHGLSNLYMKYNIINWYYKKNIIKNWLFLTLEIKNPCLLINYLTIRTYNPYYHIFQILHQYISLILLYYNVYRNPFL